MPKKVNALSTCIDVCTSTIVWMLLFLCIQKIAAKDFFPWYYTLGIPVSIIAITLFRTYIKNFIVFALCHVVLFFLGLIIPVPVFLIMEYAVFHLILTIQSITLWSTKQKDESFDLPVIEILALLIIYFYTITAQLTAFNTLVYVSGILCIGLYLIRHYLNGFKSFIISSKNATSYDLNRLWRTNSVLVIFLIVMITIFVLAANLFNMDELMYKLLNGLKNATGVILTFLATGSAPVSTESSNYDIKEGTVLPEEAGGTMSEFWEQFEKILAPLMNITAFLILFIFIGALLYSFLKQYMHRQISTTDFVEPSTPDIDMEALKKVPEAEIPSLTLSAANLSNRKKVRKLFYKRVKKHETQIGLKASLTAEEINQTLENNARESLGALTPLYNKARYSHHEITDEDIKKL